MVVVFESILVVISSVTYRTEKLFVWMQQAAVISLGLIGAGTNNARIAGMLRNLSSYYYKDACLLFCVMCFWNLSLLAFSTPFSLSEIKEFPSACAGKNCARSCTFGEGPPNP